MKKIIFALALANAFSAQAVEYTQVQPDKSAIAFVYKQMGVAVCEFRRKLVADSSRSWTVIPRQAGH